MGDSLIVTLGIAAILAIIVLALCLVGVRRINLRRALGTIDASICVATGRWQMGVCRFQGAELEWFRMFSLSPTPRYSFERSRLELLRRREPGEAEAARVQPGTVVVELSYAGQEVLLAMRFDEYTGLSSWLEAGPRPGLNRLD
ncbi:DUF2550 domain-containing protein [Arthrobacter sp. NPDC090010]|uniref:DUF2550 domain-containing protein n=1 Tax=Arthrobacter sp. NPDC090010 TaxID=3363942 RepID=UPI00380BEE29